VSNLQNNELKRIAESDDLHIAPFREDGVTYGTLTWIWSVIVGDRNRSPRRTWPAVAVRQPA
jgi:hypothetical protein